VMSRVLWSDKADLASFRRPFTKAAPLPSSCPTTEHRGAGVLLQRSRSMPVSMTLHFSRTYVFAKAPPFSIFRCLIQTAIWCIHSSCQSLRISRAYLMCYRSRRFLGGGFGFFESTICSPSSSQISTTDNGKLLHCTYLSFIMHIVGHGRWWRASGVWRTNTCWGGKPPFRISFISELVRVRRGLRFERGVVHGARHNPVDDTSMRLF